MTIRMAIVMGEKTDTDNKYEVESYNNDIAQTMTEKQFSSMPEES